MRIVAVLDWHFTRTVRLDVVATPEYAPFLGIQAQTFVLAAKRVEKRVGAG